MDSEQIGARIKKALEQEGVTMNRFAKMAGQTSGYVGYVCKGLKRPSLEIIDTLVTRFGYSAKWLLSGVGAEKMAERGTHEPDHVYLSDTPPLAMVAEPPGPGYTAGPTLQGVVADEVATHRAATHRSFQFMCAVAGIDPRPVAELHELLLEVVLRRPGASSVTELKGYLRGLVSALPPPAALNPR